MVQPTVKKSLIGPFRIFMLPVPKPTGPLTPDKIVSVAELVPLLAFEKRLIKRQSFVFAPFKEKFGA